MEKNRNGLCPYYITIAFNYNILLDKVTFSFSFPGIDKKAIMSGASASVHYRHF